MTTGGEKESLRKFKTNSGIERKKEQQLAERERTNREKHGKHGSSEIIHGERKETKVSHVVSTLGISWTLTASN
jgi:hypothetical protein